MKIISRLLILSICSLSVLCACQKVSTQSEFREFEINCSDGTTRYGGVYLPKGIKANYKYPVVYMCDGLVFKDCKFKHLLDSLIENNLMNPAIVACSFENKKNIPGYDISYRNAEYVELIGRKDTTLSRLYSNHYNYFINEFIPYIENNEPVSTSPSDRVFFGTSNSGDFGITLGMKRPDMISEYWCFSPVYSDVNDYEVPDKTATFRICWGAKEEVDNLDYFPNLMKDMRKRGASVQNWTFNGDHDRKFWTYWFLKEMERRFPYTE